MYTANRALLGFLLLYIAGQTAAGLWQYTVPGASPAPDPLMDSYEYHCESLDLYPLTDESNENIIVCIYLPPKRMYVPTLVLFSLHSLIPTNASSAQWTPLNHVRLDGGRLRQHHLPPHHLPHHLRALPPTTRVPAGLQTIGWTRGEDDAAQGMDGVDVVG